MKNILKTLAFAMVLAGVVYAARQGIGSVSKINDPKPQWFVSGLFIGSNAKDPLQNTKNKLGHRLCFDKTYDAPALGGTFSALDTYCADTSVTATGCKLGDSASVAVNATTNIGQLVFSPMVPADNLISLVICASGLSDAGTTNLGSTVYTLCCEGPE